MGVAISTLTTVTRATLISGAVISSSEHNTWSTAVKTQLNDIGTTTGVLADLEDNYASASAPGDKPAGKIWFDSANLILKWYEVAAGTLRTVVGRDTTDTLTNKTLTGNKAGNLLDATGVATYAFPDVAARTINVSGVDQNSYVSGTGTSGADATAQVVKQITLKANSLNAPGRGIRVTVISQPSSTTSIITTVYIGTTGTTASDLQLITHTKTDTSPHVLCMVITYVDATHLHFTSMTGGAPVYGSFVNQTTSINFAADMFISVAQSSAVTTHMTVFQILVEQIG